MQAFRHGPHIQRRPRSLRVRSAVPSAHPAYPALRLQHSARFPARLHTRYPHIFPPEPPPHTAAKALAALSSHCALPRRRRHSVPPIHLSAPQFSHLPLSPSCYIPRPPSGRSDWQAAVHCLHSPPLSGSATGRRLHPARRYNPLPADLPASQDPCRTLRLQSVLSGSPYPRRMCPLPPGCCSVHWKAASAFP